jgi:O-antigen ligase
MTRGVSGAIPPVSFERSLPRPRITPNSAWPEARPSLWRLLARDRFAMAVFIVCLGLFLADISDLNEYVHPYRWVFVGLLATASLGIVASARHIPQRAEHYSLYALMAVSAVSCIVSPMPDYSIQRLASFVLMFLGVFMGAWFWVQRPEKVYLVAHFLLLAVALGVGFSVWELLGEESWIPEGRIAGAFGKATGAGGFAAASLSLALWKRRYARGPWRWVWATILAVLLYLLVFSGARLAILAGLVVCVVWAWKHATSMRPIVLLGSLAVAGVGISGIVTLDMLPGYIVRKETIPTFTGRIPLWRAGLKMFAESPIIGHGYGMTRYATMIMNDPALRELASEEQQSRKAAFLRRAVEARRPVTMTLHSDQVERLAETGILGYAGFAAVWVFVLRRVYRVLRLRPSERNSLAMALGLNVLFAFFNSFFHGAMFAIGAAGTTVTWLGIVVFMAASEQVEPYRPHGLV